MADEANTSAPQTLRAQGLVNIVVRGLLRTPGLSRIVGSRLVTLYVVGRKSRRRYAVPIAYLAEGDHLLVGTSFSWARNLRTGEPIAIRLRGRAVWADVVISTTEPEVVASYAQMATANPAFARFNKIRVDANEGANREDLHACWMGGARLVTLTPR